MQDTRHNDYSSWLIIWERIRDGLAGQDAIKAKSTTYLPKLNGQMQADYDAYLKRARYINFPKRVLNIALGQLFRKNPVIEGIDEEYLDNINLAGRDFNYFSRMVAREVMIANRIGILVDYSEPQKRPYLTVYKAENIINWHVNIFDGVTKLSMIMLEGEIEQPKTDDPYQTESKKVWKELYLSRELQLTGNGLNLEKSINYGKYFTRDWEKSTDTKTGKSEFVEIGKSMPVMDGKPFDYMPFFICTSDGIVTEISESAMLDLVDVNLGHFINSADYENMIHFTGCRTIIAKGWSEKKDFPQGGFAVLPDTGDVYYLEASSDSALLEAMKRKEEQMAIIASSFITGKGRYVASAETATKTSQGEYATLADISNALSVCMKTIMSLFNEWAGSDEGITVEFNTEFEEVTLDPQIAIAWSGLVTSGLMSWETFFYNMKSKNVYQTGRTIEEEEEAIAQDTEEKIKARDEQMKQFYQNQINKNGGGNGKKDQGDGQGGKEGADAVTQERAGAV